MTHRQKRMLKERLREFGAGAFNLLGLALGIASAAAMWGGS